MKHPYKNKGLLFFSVIALLITSIYTNLVQAREGVFELYLQPHYISSKNITSSAGSSIDFDSTWGIGFGLGYNFTDHFALNFDIAWGSTNYRATTIDDNNNPVSYNSKMDSSSTIFTGTYNFSKRSFTPFVRGSLGWSYIDTNIPVGPPGSSCWWDPWYGQVCSAFIPTAILTDLTYGVGLGLRFDVTDGFFMRASYNKDWIEFDKASAQDFDVLRIDIGTMLR